MPGFDGSGPNGMGPMTGRGKGKCNPTNAVEFYGAGYRRFPPAQGARRVSRTPSHRPFGQSGRGRGNGRGRW